MGSPNGSSESTSAPIRYHQQFEWGLGDTLPPGMTEEDYVDILILRHVDCEPPAAYLPLLEARGTVRTVRLGVDPLPARRDFGAVVAMGGPMGVGDSDTLGWITEE